MSLMLSLSAPHPRTGNGKIGRHTSVSVTKGIRQVSGGTIFAIPYSCASGEIARMYDMGSRNSSRVG